MGFRAWGLGFRGYGGYGFGFKVVAVGFQGSGESILIVFSFLFLAGGTP